jgi:hypothetical protein
MAVIETRAWDYQLMHIAGGCTPYLRSGPLDPKKSVPGCRSNSVSLGPDSKLIFALT